MDTTIRRAVVGDERRLASLNRFVHELHVASRPDHFKPTEAMELEAWFRSRLEDPTTRAWIADAGGAAIGYVLTTLHERAGSPFTRVRRWREIDQLAVDSEWRKTRYRPRTHPHRHRRREAGGDPG